LSSFSLPLSSFSLPLSSFTLNLPSLSVHRLHHPSPPCTIAATCQNATLPTLAKKGRSSFLFIFFLLHFYTPSLHLSPRSSLSPNWTLSSSFSHSVSSTFSLSLFL
jgi:hypothetical protein